MNQYHQTIPMEQEPVDLKPVKLEGPPAYLSQTMSPDLREKKESLTHQKDLLAIKLRQKMKKLCKQQDLGNKQFREMSQTIRKLFDKVRDRLDWM